jgi:hypothetical protein
MLTLFDMMANAQNGQGMEALSRQFGLSQQQTQAAVEALMPAFSQGLKRNVADPYGVAGFLSAMSAQQGKYFDDAQAAFSPQGVANGNDVLGQLFGSKDLSRAVTAQAAQATGVGQDILKQMLPVLASMMMSGLFKQSTNQMQAGGFGGGNNPLGQIIEEMMKQGGGGMFGGQPQQPQPQQTNPMGDNPFGKILQDMFGGGAGQQANPRQQAPSNPMGDNPFGKMLEDMLGGGAGQQQPQAQPRQAPPSNPMGDNPWGKILEEMLGGGQPRPQAQAEEEPEPAPRQRTNPGSGQQPNPYDDIFGKMFESGRQTRDDYQKGVESIFDQFTKGMDRYR